MKSRLLGAVSACLLCYMPGIQAVPLAIGYTIEPMGLDDAVHLGNNVRFLNEAGQAAGTASRFSLPNFLGTSAWFYNGTSTVNVGMTDTEHTRNDGYQSNSLLSLSQTGHVVGQAARYNGGATDLGVSAWSYDGTNTVNIGLTGAEHTRNDSYRNSGINYFTQTGQVAGIASRFNGTGSTTGTSAWLYNGTSTVDISLTDTEHTRSDGFRVSFVSSINDAGQVAGIARRYSSATDMGQSAWLYNGTSTVNVGLTGTEHTRNDGSRQNSVSVNSINEAGQVAGTAARFNGGSTSLGQSAWLYDGTNTMNVGLTGPGYTRNDGRQLSTVRSLNEAGQVAGAASRFSGGSFLGQSAWLYNGTSTVDISLTAGEHTSIAGVRSSDVELLNEAGQVVGSAVRYSGVGATQGQSAWLYNGASTVNVGLTGTEHTRNDGHRSSDAVFLNEAGQVAGVAERYSGGSSWLGQSVWFYNGSSTNNVGLTGAEYTRFDGRQDNQLVALNAAGQVAGTAARYLSGGTSAWLYDLTLDQTFALDLSVRSDGRAVSRVEYLGDDGLLLGSYELFDIDDTSLGFRAFAFTLDDGAIDLGSLVEGGLDAAGWDSLGGTTEANSLGQIVGFGSLTGGLGSMSYILTPVSAVPVPAAVWLFGSGLLGLVGVARRKTA